MPGGARVARGKVTATGLASSEVMSKSGSRRFLVTVTRLPVTRCQICHRTVAYRPGNLGEVLTGHCRRAIPKRPASRPVAGREDPQRCPADTATGLPLGTNSPQSLAGGRQRSPNVIGAGARALE
jgi:hypothetical protein